MIELGNNPDSFGAMILHSQDSGRMLACSRTEVEAFIAAAKAGLLDPFMRGQDGTSVVVDPDRNMP
jgi:hypothetical protein